MPRNPQERELIEQFASALRASRRSRRWTQQRLADEVGISQSSVARLERARVPDVGIVTAMRVLQAVGGRLDVRCITPTAPAPQQRDRAHARCVAYVVGRLARAGWVVATEVEVEAGGGRWRSFVDILAFHPLERVVLVVEVKTEIHDIGDIDRQLGIGERGAWQAARQRGWRPRAVVPTLLVLSTRENDARLAGNRGYLDGRLRLRARDLQLIVDGSGIPHPDGWRAIAMVDPRSRRRSWLQPTRLDGRRAAAAYVDRAGYLARHFITRTTVAAVVVGALMTVVGGCAGTRTSEMPTSTSEIPTSTPPASATSASPTSLIDAAGAKAAVERFLGQPLDATVEGPDQGVNGPFFNVLAAEPAPISSAIVSASDGRILSVLWRIKIAPIPTMAITEAEAKTRARAFLDSHGISVDGMEPSTRVLDHGDVVEYEVRWQKSTRGITLPVDTIVGIDATSGEVFRFSDFRRPYSDPPDPVITIGEAADLARGAASMPGATVDSSDLKVAFAADGTQQLVWEIELTIDLSHALVDVDAITGVAVVVGRG